MMGPVSRNGKGLAILPLLGVASLVVWGLGLWSTIWFSLTPLVISLTYLPPYLCGIIVGLLLGDTSISLKSLGRLVPAVCG
jgi:hypothetical protein